MNPASTSAKGRRDGTRRCSRYIYGKRNGIHIIDIKETVKGLLLARKLISRGSSPSGKDVCFVGTKRQAKDVLEQRVGDVGMHFVTERWLGGTLTNFRTIRSRLSRLEELEAIEQDDNFQSYSKKMESQLRREMKKISAQPRRRPQAMSKLPGVMVAIDVKRETHRARRGDASSASRPICLIDTDGDPDLADIPIPGNDDSMRSIDVVVRELCKPRSSRASRTVITPRPRRTIRRQEGAPTKRIPPPAQFRRRRRPFAGLNTEPVNAASENRCRESVNK